MPIPTFCPHCSKRYELDDARAGESIRCVSCGKRFTVPEVERSPGGSQIFHHEANVNPPNITTEATPHLERIGEHIERCIGPSPMVFHELISPEVHIDLHVVSPQPHVEPSEARPLGGNYFTVVTSGVSSRPMNAPEGSPRLAELMIALPREWPGMKPDGTFETDTMSDERNWWPFRWLKTLARMPHEYDTFLDFGHTIPHGNPPEPFADNTKLCCWMIAPSTLCPVEDLVIDDDTGVRFFACLPLYREEMELKLNNGVEALIEAFEKSDAFISELIDIDRPNTVKKRRGWFRW